MARVFATLQQVRDYLDDQSLEVTDRQLRSAALLVARATRFAVYQVDGSTGQATDARIETALREATAEVVKHRDDAGVSSDVSLADLGVKSASIGTASYTVVDMGASGTYRLLPWDAYLILDGAGLLSGPVSVVG